MNAISNYDGVDSPLGAAALTMPFADLGDSPQSRLFSDRLPSADSSNDPDGPAMDNGNGNCQSPGLDSIYSEATALGTPKSFISDQFPGSPDMFTGHRERLRSTSSAYTYSPYSPALEEPFPHRQSCNSGAPALARQASLAMVEEVLGTSEDCDQLLMFNPQGDSPLTDCDEDSFFPPYPSPSFLAHFNASTDQSHAITSSQDDEFFAFYCCPDVPATLQCDGSPTESNEASSSNCNNNGGEQGSQPSSEEPTVTSASDLPVALLAPPQNTVLATMTRQSSSISDIISDSMPTNSLDASAMLQDFLEAVPSQSNTQTTYSTLNVEILSVGPCSPTVTTFTTVETVEEVAPTLASNKKVAFQLSENTEPTASSSCTGEKDALAVKRERNNAACRISRKRRKEKGLELGRQAVQFLEENANLRKEIEKLEVECKRMKQSIFSAMTNNVNNQS